MRSVVYDMTLLISGNKVWKNQQNVKEIPWHHIRSVELSKKRKSDFDINSVDTEARYQPHTKLYEDGFWEEKTENRRKRREEDKEQFQAACKDVPFEDSHVFCIDYGCRLYFPFKNNGVSAEVYIVQDMESMPEKIPCKVGTPYPNKNSYHAYNHKDSDGDCQLYTYLPDAEKEYEHVSIVCVWTVKLPVTGKSTNIKFVHIYWAGKSSQRGMNTICILQIWIFQQFAGTEMRCLKRIITGFLKILWLQILCLYCTQRMIQYVPSRHQIMTIFMDLSRNKHWHISQ